jgi:SAM-dependent methyltransferase
LTTQTSVVRCGACTVSVAIENGVVMLTPPATDQDYPQELVDLVAAVEERHYWFSSRNEVIVSTMRDVLDNLAGQRAVDIGCGTGFVMRALERAGIAAVGIDMHQVALTYARNRVRGPLFLSTATTLPFFREFDIATLFDVIEHVADDVALLVEARAVLRAGGHVVVTVPAGPGLWTTYDEVIGHKRRYDRDVLISALTRAGLRVRFVSYFNTALLLAGVVRQSPRRRPDAGRDAVDIVRRALRVPPAPINTLLRLSVKAEAPLRRLSWVRGGSLIAIAQQMD